MLGLISVTLKMKALSATGGPKPPLVGVMDPSIGTKKAGAAHSPERLNWIPAVAPILIGEISEASFAFWPSTPAGRGVADARVARRKALMMEYFMVASVLRSEETMIGCQ